MRLCKIEGCNNKHHAKEFCRKHFRRKDPYNSIVKHGNFSNQNSKGFCSEINCKIKIHRRGLCRKHYNILRGGCCQVNACIESEFCRKLCKQHYQALLRKGTTKIRKCNKNGEGSIENGYKTIYKPNHPNARSNGRILEHRYMVEQHIGRLLLSNETVHHIDGDRSNNEISNLEIWNISDHANQPQLSGARAEDLFREAQKIIKLYDGIKFESNVDFKINYDVDLSVLKTLKRVKSGKYISIKAKDHPNANKQGHVFEHRYIASLMIGRPLEKSEHIHHINAITTDNSPKNLQIWNKDSHKGKNHPKGARASNLFSWAKEIINLYGQTEEQTSDI